MADYVGARDLGKTLCRLFGLDPDDVTSIEIRCDFVGRGYAVVEITRHVRESEVEGMKTIFQRFRLVEEDSS